MSELPVDDEVDAYHLLIAMVQCDRCRLEVPFDDTEVVTFTESSELWCSDCRG